MKLAMTILLAAAAAGTAHASGYVGVYGLITKVTMEPNAQNPDRVRIDGVFTLASPDKRGTFEAPRRGYLYYTIPASANRAVVLREWKDMEAAAGTGTVIGFGGASFTGVAGPAPCLHPENDKPAHPDPYEVGAGLVKMRPDTNYAPVKALVDFK
jgi:hypothetical protein